MSAEDTPADRPPVATRHASEPGARASDRTTHGHTPHTGSTSSNRPEHDHCHERIAALERSLEESERRRQAIIDQYERILEDRDDTSTDGTDDGPLTRVRKLRARFG